MKQDLEKIIVTLDAEYNKVLSHWVDNATALASQHREHGDAILHSLMESLIRAIANLHLEVSCPEGCTDILVIRKLVSELTDLIMDKREQTEDKEDE